jgi:nucleoside-diphosphate-sugar epimerase
MVGNCGEASFVKIVVTGASGFIGSALVPRLLAAQHHVRVVTRDLARLKQQPWVAAVEIIAGNLASQAVCEQAVVDRDVVLNLAGLAHVGASRAAHEVENFNNTCRLATAAQAHQVQRFVQLSSCKANYPAHSSYGYYKLASEQHLLSLQGAMEVVCLRPGIVYGEGMRNNLRTLLRGLSKRQLPVFLSATNTISMISLQDCCSAILAGLTRPGLQGCSWALTDGVPYSLDTLVRQIRANYGLPMPARRCPQWLVQLGCCLLEPVARVSGSGLGLRTYKALYHEDYSVDLAFATTSGVAPTTDFYSYLRTTIPVKTL